MKTINCLGYQISTDHKLIEFSNKCIINTINPHCYCEAKKDQMYREALQQSDLLLPDGIGIVWAIKILTGLKIKRFTGSDLHLQLLKKMNETGGKVFYVGSSGPTLQKIHDRIKQEFPNILMASFSPPYKPVFTNEENGQILASINEFQPEVLFVGMTAPKQEKWVYQHKEHINVKIIASIGAVFDFYAGTIKRSGTFWINIGLEWLPRLLREPKRLWRRNFKSTPNFLWDVFIIKLSRK